MPCASTSESRQSVSCRSPALTGAHQRGSGCPALALSTELRGNGPAGGPRTHCLAIKSRLLLRMSFHGMLVPRTGHDPARFRLKVGCSARLSYRGTWYLSRELHAYARRRAPVFETGVSAVPPERHMVRLARVARARALAHSALNAACLLFHHSRMLVRVQRFAL